ncbi:MAG TPA: hypothetical protein VEC99_14075 [Clostridia bacterium]|nr:hypothetical protein [Clostridia bacterium]
MIQSGELFEKLKAKAETLSPSLDDQIIAVVYEDVTTQRRIVTRGEIVVAGTRTLQKHPDTCKYPFHFRKTFTPDSGPLSPSRKETPALEFAKTTEIYRELPDKVPEPLGYDTWTYRSAPVCGWTLRASSPFEDISYDAAFALQPNHELLVAHTKGVLAVCELLDLFHAKGIIHEDLTLYNAMLYFDARHQIQPILIDLAASVRLESLAAEERDEAINGDFSELHRDLALAQFHLGPIDHQHARTALKRRTDLFDKDALAHFEKLTPSKQSSIDDIE